MIQIILLLALISRLPSAHAEQIEQVSSQPRTTHEASQETLNLRQKLMDEQRAQHEEMEMDFQKEVLSNPTVSDIARARSMTGNGGNTAIISQNGHTNRSSVIQKGANNYARQEQEGKSNDLYVEQWGKDNVSEESQIGDYNHKVKVQNGREEILTRDEDDEQ